jgi:hypothetical protein
MRLALALKAVEVVEGQVEAMAAEGVVDLAAGNSEDTKLPGRRHYA